MTTRVDARTEPRRQARARTRDRQGVRSALLPHLAALALCLLALAATAWVATAVFDRLPHVEDDVAFLFQAKTIAAGHLLASPPASPEFFWIPFVLIRDGHWFGKYPPGYPAVLALGVLSGAPWLLNPVIGALDVGLVYLLGRRLYGAGTGLLAAALLLVSPFFLLQAGSFMSHTVSLFWALLFLLFFVRSRETGERWPATGAGAAIGMLFLTRPLTAVGIGLPVALWMLVDLLRDRGLVRVYLPAALAFLPFALAMLAYNQLTTGHPFEFAYVLWWPYDKIGFGPGHGLGDTGHTLASGKLNTEVNLDQLGHYLYGWPGKLSLVPLALGGLLGIGGIAWRAVHSERRQPYVWDLLLCGVVVSLIGVHVAYWTAGMMYGPRYYFEAIGAMTLLTARVALRLADLLGWLLGRAFPGARRTERQGRAVVLLLLAGLTLSSFTGFTPRALQAATNWYDINGDGVRQVQAAGIHHAVVFVKMKNWTDYAPFFCQNSLTLDGDVVYAIDLGQDDPRLMAQYPGRSYYRFDHGKLTRLG